MQLAYQVLDQMVKVRVGGGRSIWCRPNLAATLPVFIYWYSIYRVGQIKRGQCSFFRRSKACFREFWWFLACEI